MPSAAAAWAADWPFHDRCPEGLYTGRPEIPLRQGQEVRNEVLVMLAVPLFAQGAVVVGELVHQISRAVVGKRRRMGLADKFANAVDDNTPQPGSEGAR